MTTVKIEVPIQFSFVMDRDGAIIAKAIYRHYMEAKIGIKIGAGESINTKMGSMTSYSCGTVLALFFVDSKYNDYPTVDNWQDEVKLAFEDGVGIMDGEEEIIYYYDIYPECNSLYLRKD